MRGEILRKIWEILKNVLFFLLILTSFLLMARTYAGKTAGKPEESVISSDGYEISALFPDETTREARLINECGWFIDELNGFYQGGDTDSIASMLAEEAYSARYGREIDRASLQKAVLTAKISHPDRVLKMKYAVIREETPEYGPDAVIAAELVKEKEEGEEEYLNEIAYPVYIYVYLGEDDQIECFLIPDMVTGR